MSQPRRKNSAVSKRQDSRRFSTSNQNVTVVREGTLQKKGKGFAGWQSRWFSAAGHYLRYWNNKEESERDEKLLAAIDLRQVGVEDSDSEGKFKLLPWEEKDGAYHAI